MGPARSLLDVSPLGPGKVAPSVARPGDLAPGILIASPPLADPNFDRSVVLLASHDGDGAFGWVINGRHVMTVRELLTRADITPAGTDVPHHISGEVRLGGPVSQEQVWLIYPSDEQVDGVDGQFEVAPGVMATASRTFLEKLAEGYQVPNLVAIAGYAGWGPGQLEGEIQSGGWLPGPSTADLIFGTPREEAWQRAYASLGTTPMAFTTRTIGSA